jgi:hypothetical protein
MPLPIKVEIDEMYDEETNRFISFKPQTLILEHSLVSISKWESKWHKMFLETNNKTGEEFLDYIRCMTINKDVNPFAYYALSQKNIDDIVKYMDDPMTASSVNTFGRSGPHERVSSELIYYWMFTYGIPIEVEKWHINRLLMLIKIFSRKNSKMSKADKAAADRQRAELNRKRCAALGTRG